MFSNARSSSAAVSSRGRGLRGGLLDLEIGLVGKDVSAVGGLCAAHAPVQIGGLDVAQALRLARANEKHVCRYEVVALDIRICLLVLESLFPVISDYSFILADVTTRCIHG